MRAATLTLVLAAFAFSGSAHAQSELASPSAAQPRLPSAEVPPGPSAVPTKPSPPVVDKIVDPAARPPLHLRVRKAHDRMLGHTYVAHADVARHRRRGAPADLDRPALAGVTLLAPVPAPGEPPHITVPLPAYPLDSVAWALTAPPPPIVCRKVRREPGLPDPHLYREVAVECVPDNP